MPDRPTLAVCYDKGAASATEIAAAVGDVADLVFVVRDNEHTARLMPVLAQLGQVVDLADADTLTSLAGVVTFSEPMLRPASALAAARGLAQHDPRTVVLLTDKFQQRERLRAAGVDTVRFRRVRGKADWWPALREVGLPAVMKPVCGGASRDTHLIDDQDTARRLLAGLSGDFVVEEYLQGQALWPYGDYVSVESHCTSSGVHHFAVTGKFPLEPPFREVGQFWPAKLAPRQRSEVLDLVTDAVSALGVRFGFTHTEVKLTEDGPRLIEVNGRLGGHLPELAKRACGVDLVRANCLLALGQAVSIEDLTPRRVYFQYNSAGPTIPCQVTAVHGANSVRKMPGITGYTSRVRIGDPLPGGVMTHALDLLCGAADNHDAMIEVLNRALRELSFEFSRGDGSRVVVTPSLGGVTTNHGES